MYMVHPSQTERYYLHLLLTKIKEATSFDNLKTVNGSLCKSFKQAAYLRGFIENNNEYQLCIAEAREFQMPQQLPKDFTQKGYTGDCKIQAVLKDIDLILQRQEKQ
ncbi:22139_t:CDS:2 [Gigaspora margarita]|uniref:22139_t:CDS:1 n=1 Tax=Gigaspora margarita TaxID=4874 RepID=A0ABN7VFX6_GIGMA|nr:22139_t:CDS:2 [Gigaspora margarita]